jgi:hypothetical protein
MALILDADLAGRLGVDLTAHDVRRVDGIDESGNRLASFFTKLSGSIRPGIAPDFQQKDPAIVFQKTIYDGLIGRDFRHGHGVTFGWAEPA